MIDTPKTRLLILTPVFDDWASLCRLIEELERVQQGADIEIAGLVVVNDCSLQEPPVLSPVGFAVTLLQLGWNLGHQRAIAVGIGYINAHCSDYDALVVMDSDGEDDPRYLPAFADALAATGAARIVFAERRKRSEGLVFRVGYRVYRAAFRALTGHRIAFGNFSCIPRGLLARVARLPDLWNHFSASILRSRIAYSTIATDRSRRYFGESKLRLSGLVIHGLSAVSIYLDVVVVRILIAAGTGLAAVFALVLVIVGIRLLTDLAIPGWASTVSLALLNFGGLFFVVALLVLMMHLSQRGAMQQPVVAFYENAILSVEQFGD